MSNRSANAAEQKFRIALYRTLTKLIDDAAKQAREGKPALLRVLTRATGSRAKAANRADSSAPSPEEQRNWQADIAEIKGPARHPQSN